MHSSIGLQRRQGMKGRLLQYTRVTMVARGAVLPFEGTIFGVGAG
jgi:hypothetical protein